MNILALPSKAMEFTVFAEVIFQIVVSGWVPTKIPIKNLSTILKLNRHNNVAIKWFELEPRSSNRKGNERLFLRVPSVN